MTKYNSVIQEYGMKTSGYCNLCRAKEVELFGTVLDSGDKRHKVACKKAGCRHPYYYNFDGIYTPINNVKKRK